MPLQCNAFLAFVYIDDVIFPRYPREVVEERIQKKLDEIAGARDDIRSDQSTIDKKKGQIQTLLRAPTDDDATDEATSKKKASQAQAMNKQVAKLEARIEQAKEVIATAEVQIETDQRILSIDKDELVELVVTLNGEAVVKERFANLPRAHVVIRLDAVKKFPLPETKKVAIEASLRGRWNDQVIKKDILTHVPLDQPRIDDTTKRLHAAIRALGEIEGDDDPPESEFDEDYMDRIDALEEHRDEIDRLRSEIDSLNAELATLTPKLHSSDLVKEGLVWRCEDGASAVNGRAFRLQIRVEVMYAIREAVVPLLRSHSLEGSSSNLVEEDHAILIHDASHFGDKHAIAGTLALYKEYRAVIADETGAAGAQRHMRWYLNTAGGVKNPCIMAGQSALDTHIIPFLTGPGSATRLMANKFRRDGVDATLAALRKKWLKEKSPDEFHDDVAPHVTAVAGWLRDNGKGIPSADAEVLLDARRPKVVLWQRAKPFKTEGNPSKELILQLADELLARGLVPLIIGETFPLSSEDKTRTGAIDFTGHWRHDVFSREDSNHLRQVYMFDLLARKCGLVGVIGGKSGSLECTAMLGITTMWFCDGAPPFYEPRLYQWDMIPHYRAISIAGLVETRRLREGAYEQIPYAEQRIGKLRGRALGLVRACLDEIRRRGGPCVDLSGVEPARVAQIEEM